MIYEKNMMYYDTHLARKETVDVKIKGWAGRFQSLTWPVLVEPSPVRPTIGLSPVNGATRFSTDTW